MTLNIDMVKKIQLDRIGDTCFFDTVSCSLEYMDRLYWALDYVNYKFLYNYDKFIEFREDTNLEKRISKTDAYYFFRSPDSVHHNDVWEYTWNLWNRKLGKIMCLERKTAESFFNEFENNMHSKIPIILQVNNLEYSDFYKLHGFTIPRSDAQHMVNILDISNDGKRGFIYDRGFDCFGSEIDINHLYKGATSKFLKENGDFKYWYFLDKPKELLPCEIKDKFIESLLRGQERVVCINDTTYINNNEALKKFKADIPKIVKLFKKRYGAFATPLIGEIIVIQVDGAMGLVGLYRAMNKYINCSELEEILPAFRYYWELWRSFELRLQYIVYKNEKLENYISSLQEIIEKLLYMDNILQRGCSHVLEYLVER
ncbi:MAG: hypothetical protein HFE72_03510 [Emergencia sp.]|nr:hypothetical protein [Emergencia sp.]